MTGSALKSTLPISGGSASGGSCVGDARDAVAHVVRGLVDVAIGHELEVDARAAVDALRGDLGDALEARDALLDHLGDLGLDHVGRGTAVGGLDRHDRRLDLGQLAYRQALEASRPRITSSRLTTVAKTGRCTETVEIFMARPPPAAGPPALLQRDRRAVAQLLRAFGDDQLAGGQPVQRPARRRRGAGRVCTLRFSAVPSRTTNTNMLPLLRHQRLLRHQQRRRSRRARGATVRNMPGLSRPSTDSAAAPAPSPSASRDRRA